MRARLRGDCPLDFDDGDERSCASESSLQGRTAEYWRRREMGHQRFLAHYRILAARTKCLSHKKACVVFTRILPLKSIEHRGKTVRVVGSRGKEDSGRKRREKKGARLLCVVGFFSVVVGGRRE